MEHGLHAVSDCADEAGPETLSQLSRPIGQDTAFMCFLALVFVRCGLWIAHRGWKLLSPAHPGRRANSSAAATWHGTLRRMPWRGFVPTAEHAISLTQATWVVVGLLAVQPILYVLALPCLPIPELGENLPHLTYQLSR